MRNLTPAEIESIKTELELIATESQRAQDELAQNKQDRLLVTLNCIRIFSEKAICTLEGVNE